MSPYEAICLVFCGFRLFFICPTLFMSHFFWEHCPPQESPSEKGLFAVEVEWGDVEIVVD